MAPGLHLRFVLLFLFTSVCTSNAFNFYSRNLDSAPPILLESPIRSESDLLDQSLSKAFPSRTHANPAYAEVFKYLESLSTAPSCHRAATASLITDCNTLESTSAAGYRYAAHLAVCEFEAAGVAYPHECKDIARRGHHRCMKRLEERPQWWTTFSNSNQNAMMICVAVRHEVEQGVSRCSGFGVGANIMKIGCWASTGTLRKRRSSS